MEGGGCQLCKKNTRGWGINQELGMYTHTTTYKIDNQQGQDRECHSMFCDNLHEKRI